MTTCMHHATAKILHHVFGLLLVACIRRIPHHNKHSHMKRWKWMILWILQAPVGSSFHVRNRGSNVSNRDGRWCEEWHVRRRSKIVPTSVRSGDIDPGEADQGLLSERKKTVQAATFNLIKAMIGSGIFALPSGVAAISDSKRSLFAAVALMVFLGVLSAYTFGLYGRLVHGLSTHPSSLGELWKDVMGEESAWIISCASLTFCFGAALSYSILLGDTFSAMAQTIGLSGFCASRRLWILLLTGTILFPLCNMKSLLALAPLSITGVFGVLFSTVVLGWRCPIINPSSPYNVGGRYLESLSLQQLPRFDTISRGFASPYSLILGGMAAFAYLGHFSAPSFYHAIQGEDRGKKGEESDGTALDAYFKVTLRGFTSVILINCLAMIFGFLTFGGNSSGIIINNFSTLDPMASLCRLLMGVCVLGGYPFLIAACREELLELWRMQGRGRAAANAQLEKKVTAGLLCVLTGISLFLNNVGFVVGLNGSLVGSALVYVFPSLMFLNKSRRQQGALTFSLRLERWLCRFLVGFGMFAGVSGAGAVIANSFLLP